MLSNVHICQSMCQSVKTLIHLASSYLVLLILFYLPISLSTYIYIYIYIYAAYAHWISADLGANRLSAYGIWSNLGENRKLDRSRGSKENHGFCGSMKARSWCPHRTIDASLDPRKIWSNLPNAWEPQTVLNHLESLCLHGYNPHFLRLSVVNPIIPPSFWWVNYPISGESLGLLRHVKKPRSTEHLCRHDTCSNCGSRGVLPKSSVASSVPPTSSQHPPESGTSMSCCWKWWILMVIIAMFIANMDEHGDLEKKRHVETSKKMGSLYVFRLLGMIGKMDFGQSKKGWLTNENSV